MGHYLQNPLPSVFREGGSVFAVTSPAAVTLFGAVTLHKSFQGF